tara:strand:+ start:4138 stop:5868 length:1731 start_codon:yes stop_codon:yes gene_type:complete
MWNSFGVWVIYSIFHVVKLIKDILKSNPEKTLHLYLRVSTEIQQTKGHSLETQLKEGMRVSKKFKLNYMIWDEGAKSGSKNIEDRIVFNNLMYEVRNGNVKHIFFLDVSRASRKYEYEYLLLKTCYDYSVQLYDVNQKYDLDDDAQMMMLRLQSMFVQFENKQRRMKSIIGKRDHFLRGGWRGGITPLGYDTIERKLVINKEESKWVKKMFKMYVSGKTPTDISNLFYSKGVKPRKSKSGIFNIGTIQVMLKNEIYCGVDRMCDPLDKSVIHTYKGVPQIIDRKLFNQVQKLISTRRRLLHNTGKNKKSTFPVLLRKMIFCDCCGEMWGVRVSVARNHYVYYCRNRENKWGNRTPNRTIRKCEVKRSCNIPETDRIVWDTIIELNRESNILKEKDKTKILQPINPDQSRSWKQRFNYLEKQNKLLNDKKNFIYQQFISNDIDKLMLETLNKDLNSAYTKNHQEIDELKIKMDTKQQKDGFIDWVGKRQNRIKGMSNITDTNKKVEILKEFIDKVFINHQKDTNTFIIKLRLKLPLFNDKLVWNNKRDKSKGYKIKEGSYEITKQFNWVSNRPKKKD